MNIFARAFYLFTEVLIWAIIIRSFAVTLTRGSDNGFTSLLRMFTDPILVPIRNLLFRFRGNQGMIDFSPLIAIVLISIVRNVILNLVAR